MKGNEVEILLRDMQEYSQLKDRVNTIFGGTMTLKDVVDSIERVSKLQKSNPFNARVLTYDEAAMWDEYRKIGTPEECRAAMEKQRKKLVKNQYGTSYIWKAGYCPVCGCGVTARWDYCQCCGQKLNWENA